MTQFEELSSLFGVLYKSRTSKKKSSITVHFSSNSTLCLHFLWRAEMRYLRFKMRRQDGALISVSITVIHCHLHLCFHWQINWTYSFRYFVFVITIPTFSKHQTTNGRHVSHPSSSLPKLLFTPRLYSVICPRHSLILRFSHVLKNDVICYVTPCSLAVTA